MKKFKTIDIVTVSLAAALMCICSWIQIPSAIPFTLQTFAVFFAAFVLGAGKSFMAMLIYIFLGIVGLPVFSGFQSGISALLGPTGGFVISFLFCVPIVGAFANKKGLSLPFAIFYSAIGLLVCYAIGTLWYTYIYSNGNIAGAFSICVLPFVIPDTIKIFFALVIAKKVSPMTKKIASNR